MEIDMTWRIDQVEFICVAIAGIIHNNGTCFDRNSTSPLELHVVQQLLLHLSLRNGSRVFEQAVGQSAFAVVDVGDNTEVADQMAAGRCHGVGNVANASQ